MRLTWALLAFLEGASAVDTYAAVALKDCSGQIGCKGFYRGFGVTTSPPQSSFEPISNVTGLSVAAIGAQASSSGGVGQASLDVAGFRFKTPADISDGDNRGLSFYFGYLGVQGNWDQSTRTAAVTGALAEVVSTLSSINVWYDNDGATGFKWDISQADTTKRWNILDCAGGEAKGYDTLDLAGRIELKDLTWSPIDHTKVACTSIPDLKDAPAACEIHTLKTSGSLGTSSVITFTTRIASQPVLINKVLHGPGFAKFDVEVRYPWASKTLYKADKARLALIAFNAGKSGTFAASAKRNADGDDSLVFAAEGSKSQAYYSFKSTAIISNDGATIDTGISAPVTTQVITGQQIIDFDCPIGSPCALTQTAGTAAILKLGVIWLQSFGWKSSITIHALGDTVKPANVFWDPSVGAGNGEASSAFVIVPSAMFLMSALFY